MISEKKISLKHYVNTDLKKKVEASVMSERQYPLYVEIIYRRQHIQIKSIIDKPFAEDLQNVTETDRNLMTLELERIHNIIRFEEKLFKDDHKLKGIGNRYANYNAAVFAIVDDGLRVKLKKTIRQHWPEQSKILNFDISVVPCENLFAAAKALWPEMGCYFDLKGYETELKIWEIYFEKFSRKELGKFKYPAFIDWMADKHFDKMMKLLMEENIAENIIEENLWKVNQTIKLSTVGQ